MKKIELSGAVGEEIELKYKDDVFVLRLGEHGIVPDITGATIKAMKKDANAFLYAAQMMYRGDYSGESHAKARVGAVVKAMFDEIPAPKKTDDAEKKIVEDRAAAEPAKKEEKKIVEETTSTAKSAKVEEKTATTTAKKTTTTTSAAQKKSTATTANKKKGA